MGYTHYWYTKPNITKYKWDKLTNVVKDLIAGVDILQFEYNQPKKPVANTKLIRFNGIGEDGHETLYIERNGKIPEWQKDRERVFGFCKTAYKPYDTYVTATLLLAHMYLGDEIDISSDGDVADWQAGVNLINKTVGEKYGFRVSLEKNPDAKYPESVETAIFKWEEKELTN